MCDAQLRELLSSWRSLIDHSLNFTLFVVKLQIFEIFTFTSWRNSFKNSSLSWSLIASHSWSLIATIIQRCSRIIHFKTRTNIFKKTAKINKVTSASQSSRNRDRERRNIEKIVIAKVEIELLSSSNRQRRRSLSRYSATARAARMRRATTTSKISKATFDKQSSAKERHYCSIRHSSFKITKNWETENVCIKSESEIFKNESVFTDYLIILYHIAHQNQTNNHETTTTTFIEIFKFVAESHERCERLDLINRLIR